MRWFVASVVTFIAACSGGSNTGDPGGGSATGGNTGTAGNIGGNASMGGGGAGGDANGGGGSGGQQPLAPLEDFTIGPYPSALGMLDASLDAAFAAYDTSTSYSHSAAQGYTLQSVGALLRVSEEHLLPGGSARQVALVTAALDEIDELRLAADQVLSGGPAFGLSDAWDAFGDGTENPAYTAYTWQSGMVAVGIAEVLRFATRHPELFADSSRIDDAVAFLGQLIDYWTPFYTPVAIGAESGGYFWYSDQVADDMAVHNTSALIAIASEIYGELIGDDAYRDRGAAYARLLKARLTTTAGDGYSWNYVDDGYPVGSRRAEDVSHALVTTQFMRFAAEVGWWNDTDMSRLSRTFTRQMWKGLPARLNGRVDGSGAGDTEWVWTRAAVIGFAANADALGGEPALFDYARSILLSSYLTPFDRALTGASLGPAQMLALARMFEHRPDAYAPDSMWSMVAGPDDTMPGGARFYTVDWNAPTDVDVAGLSLVARVAQTDNANLLVDLSEAAPRVAVSITYSATTAGDVQQWDGQTYLGLGALPATRAEDGSVRWMRTTVMLNPDRFDYQAGVDGTNILLQLTNTPTVHRIEATPLP